MLAKKYLLWACGGAIAISIAVTVNVVINDNTDSQSATNKQLSCTELQQAIDDIGRPGFGLLPENIADNVRMMQQDRTCNLSGKNWSLVNSKLQVYTTTHTNIHDGENILNDSF